MACCEATSEAIWLRNVICRFKIVKSTSSTLTICYNNATIINFSQMMKVMPVQSVFILSINLLEKRCASVIFITTYCILVILLSEELDVKLFANK